MQFFRPGRKQLPNLVNNEIRCSTECTGKEGKYRHKICVEWTIFRLDYYYMQLTIIWYVENGDSLFRKDQSANQQTWPIRITPGLRIPGDCCKKQVTITEVNRLLFRWWSPSTKVYISIKIVISRKKRLQVASFILDLNFMKELYGLDKSKNRRTHFVLNAVRFTFQINRPPILKKNSSQLHLKRTSIY